MFPLSSLRMAPSSFLGSSQEQVEEEEEEEEGLRGHLMFKQTMYLGHGPIRIRNAASSIYISSGVPQRRYERERESICLRAVNMK